MSASLKSLKAPVTEFQAALAGFGVRALTGGAMFRASVEAANDWNTEITKAFQGDGDDRRGSQRDGGCVEAYRPLMTR